MVKKFATLIFAVFVCTQSYASETNDNDFVTFSGNSIENNNNYSQTGTRLHGSRNKRKITRVPKMNVENDINSEEMREVDRLSTEAIKKIVKRENNIEEQMFDLQKETTSLKTELSELKSGIKKLADNVN